MEKMLAKKLCIRIARWYIFKPKIQFGGILEGLAKEDVVFTGIWYSLWT
jgi:hypothetical protein